MTEIENIEQSNSLEMTSSFPPYIPLSLYGELIKIKQTLLLLYTGILTYFITAWPTLEFFTLFWLIFSLFFAISGSTLFNMYIDRDIDALMERTKQRAVPSRQVRPSTVLKHGFIFTGGGILTAMFFINWVTGLVIFLGSFFDVIIYSIWLKRRTKYSILFGGVAGGLPAIAGCTAATGTINLTTVLFGLFVITWIPLHILTLALLQKNLEGYKNAKVPMWPVVSGPIQTIRVITTSALLITVVVVLTAISLNIHLFFLFPLFILNLYVIYLSIKNFRHPSEGITFRLFKLASVIMVFSFLWLLIGVVMTDVFFN